MLRRLPILAIALSSACSADRGAPSPAFAPTPAPSPASSMPPLAPVDADAGPVAADALPSADATSPDAGATTPPPPPPRPRIGSVGRITWIYGQPSRKVGPIGFIRPGTSVTLRSEEPTRGPDCTSNRWYAIEPRGFVCNDSTTTLALDSEPFKALAALGPDRTSPWPYRYAYSTGAPMYGRLPAAEQQRKVERAWRPVDKLPRNTRPRSGHEELAGWDPIAGTDSAPYFAGGAELPRMPGQRTGLLRWEIPEGQMLSYRMAFEHQCRVFLASPDLTLVPADRMRPFRPSDFHGVVIEGDVKLPIAWIRHAPKDRYRRADDGTIAKTADTWPARSWIQLTGHKVTRGSEVFLETCEQGVFVRQADASVVEMPDRLPLSVGEDEKWIDVSLERGTLTLFVGNKPVFSTLMSPGAGGPPPASAKTNEEHVKGSWTPVGIYRVTYKVRETTMTPENKQFPEKNWIADVPYTLYFRMPFAIHGAYWHEDFGMPKSGGCVNLSPLDARRVFDWAEPALPNEWSGVSGVPANGLGTRIHIRR